jgi:hypothetical protein
MLRLKLTSSGNRPCELTVLDACGAIGTIDQHGLHAYVPWGTRAVHIRRHEPQNVEVGTYGLVMARVDSIYTLE